MEVVYFLHQEERQHEDFIRTYHPFIVSSIICSSSITKCIGSDLLFQEVYLQSRRKCFTCFRCLIRQVEVK